MDKPEDVTITQITAAGTDKSLMVFGLGSDQKIYYWLDQKRWVEWPYIS